MGLDVDYIAAKQAIEKLESLLGKQKHGEREEIADEILNFVMHMENKWGKNKKSSNDRQS